MTKGCETECDWGQQWPIGVLYLGCPEPCLCTLPSIGFCIVCGQPHCAGCLQQCIAAAAPRDEDYADSASGEYDEKQTQVDEEGAQADLAFGEYNEKQTQADEEAAPEVVVSKAAPNPSADLSDESGQYGKDVHVNILEAWRESRKAVTRVDETHLVGGIKHLSSLSKCYLPSDDGGWRQWGTSQGDWKKLLRVLDWDIGGIILLNLTRQRCAVYDPGEPVYFEPVNGCLEWLASHKDTLGVLQRGKETNYEFALVDVQDLREERTRTKSQQLERLADRIGKVLVSCWDDVRFLKIYAL